MDQNNDDKGIDLSHALDGLNNRVRFEGEEFQRSRQSFQTPTPKIIELVIKYSGGYVKDEQQANYVLIGFVVLAIVVSLFFIFNLGTPQGDTGKFSPPGENTPPQYLPQNFKSL